MNKTKLEGLYFYISILALAILVLPLIFVGYSSPPKTLSSDSNTNTNFVPGELIIKFKKGVKPQNLEPQKTGIAALDTLNQQNNASSLKPVFKKDKGDLGQFYKIKVPKDKNIYVLAKKLRKIGEIEKVSPNFKARAALSVDDPDFSSQWGLSKIDIETAWDYTTGSSNVTIAAIDSGVDTDHPEITGKIWTNDGEVGGGKETNGVDDDLNGLIDDWRGWDYVDNVGYAYLGGSCVDRDGGDPNRTEDNDPNPEPSGIDEDICVDPGTDAGVDHGSFVSGIAAANTNNATGMAGICHDCKIMALRILDDEGWGDFDDLADAITYAADEGADIINLSLSGGYDDTTVHTAINHAYEAGVIIVAAASNGGWDGIGDNIDASPLSPICNDNYEYTDGGDNQVIGVAATNSSDVKPTFSNYGKKYVDISAPGVSIYSLTNDAGYTTAGGTSASTPFVAGVAALVKAQNPTWSVQEIRDRTIDLIENINAENPSYRGKLGGRVKPVRALNSSNRIHASGTLFKPSSSATIYRLENGQKRAFPSGSIYFSYYQSWGYIATISSSQVDDYPNGPDLLFREGTLIKGSGATVYQVEFPSSTKRPINSAQVFFDLGYAWGDVITTSNSILNRHPLGSTISDANTHVAGALVKTVSSATVYLLQDSSPTYRHPVISGQVYGLKFRWQDLATIDNSEMSGYTLGSSYRFQDGFLIKGSGSTVYQVSYNEKRPFTSGTAFTSRGFNWGQIIAVSDSELLNYTTGETLN